MLIPDAYCVPIGFVLFVLVLLLSLAFGELRRKVFKAREDLNTYKKAFTCRRSAPVYEFELVGYNTAAMPTKLGTFKHFYFIMQEYRHIKRDTKSTHHCIFIYVYDNGARLLVGMLHPDKLDQAFDCGFTGSWLRSNDEIPTTLINNG